MPYSWLYYDLVKNVSKDKTIHSCQIPSGLVEKIFLASTEEKDLIFIHFGGSGNEIMLAKKLKRNFISAELDKTYYKMIIERLKQNGNIPSEYKLQMNNIVRNDLQALTLFDNKTKKAKSKQKKFP